jgi:lysyl-tRNA synthetase class 1
MYGKDHSTNTPIYDAICEILGAPAPEHFTYELFLDENGQKISKSSGNGISIDEWLSYAATESLSYFMFGKPKTAKRLYFDVIPKAVDEYHQQLRPIPARTGRSATGEPGLPHPFGRGSGLDMVVSFAMLLNLASVAHAETRTRSGASSAATRPRRRPKPIPTSTRRPVSRCATTTIS